jgi:hypothetical protein
VLCFDGHIALECYCLCCLLNTEARERVTTGQLAASPHFPLSVLVTNQECKEKQTEPVNSRKARIHDTTGGSGGSMQRGGRGASILILPLTEI